MLQVSSSSSLHNKWRTRKITEDFMSLTEGGGGPPGRYSRKTLLRFSLIKFFEHFNSVKSFRNYTYSPFHSYNFVCIAFGKLISSLLIEIKGAGSEAILET